MLGCGAGLPAEGPPCRPGGPHAQGSRPGQPEACPSRQTPGGVPRPEAALRGEKLGVPPATGASGGRGPIRAPPRE